MTWSVELDHRALKELAAVPIHIARRARVALEKLEANPRPVGAKKLRGSGDERWRVRVGDWRMVYAIDDRNRRVLVLSIDHRGKVYR